MRCFPCFSSHRNEDGLASPRDGIVEPAPQGANKQKVISKKIEEEANSGAAKHFNFRELASATKNFRQECLLGEGAFGRVYKGTLQSTSQVVAVKQLDRHGLLGNKEFVAEVQNLSQLRHSNLINLLGYCADGDQRLLVYEYVTGGSVQDHLADSKTEKKPLDWISRMKIAYGAAQGVEYLHETADPPVLYRDLKASNILLDDEFNPKLSDFGLHKLGYGTGDKMPLSCGVMGTHGHCAPEYVQGGHLTSQSDVYSFGVLLLELITGRRAVDTTRPVDEQNLVAWAQPIFKDPKEFPNMADPLLNNQFSERGLNQAVAIAAMCLQEEPAARPLISDVMTALSFLSLSSDESIPTAIPITSFRDKTMSIRLNAIQRPSFDNSPDSTKNRDKDQKEPREEVDLDYGSYSDSQGLQEDHDLRKCKSSESDSSFESRDDKDSKKSADDSVSSSGDTGRDDSSRFLSFGSNSQITKDCERGLSSKNVSSKFDEDENVAKIDKLGSSKRFSDSDEAEDGIETTDLDQEGSKNSSGEIIKTA